MGPLPPLIYLEPTLLSPILSPALKLRNTRRRISRKRSFQYTLVAEYLASALSNIYAPLQYQTHWKVVRRFSLLGNPELLGRLRVNCFNQDPIKSLKILRYSCTFPFFPSKQIRSSLVLTGADDASIHELLKLGCNSGVLEVPE